MTDETEEALNSADVDGRRYSKVLAAEVRRLRAELAALKAKPAPCCQYHRNNPDHAVSCTPKPAPPLPDAGTRDTEKRVLAFCRSVFDAVVWLSSAYLGPKPKKLGGFGSMDDYDDVLARDREIAEWDQKAKQAKKFDPIVVEARALYKALAPRQEDKPE